MIRTTPFHDRLAPLNRTGLYLHWSGHLSALKYQMDAKFEYFAVRNAAGIIDTSPLYKYRITGPDATPFLAGVLARDIRTCRDGQAQYTIWCDDAGHVVEDGVAFRHTSDHYLLTSAEPNLAWFSDRIGRLRVSIEDVSDQYGSLAVQGPRSRALLARLAPEVETLGFFRHVPTRIGGADVQISRTGYTGDLGYEVWVERDDALAVYDAIAAAATGTGIIPVGQDALLMLRVEAGLVLIGADFHSSRYAYVDDERSTPHELGFGWMLKDVATTDRAFIGRDAIRRELAEGRTRWSMVGLRVDWQDWDRLYRAEGLIPPKDHTPVTWEMLLYDDDGNRVGYTTSFMYSPVLQRNIAMARVHPAHGAPGSIVHLEVTVNHRYQTVRAEVARPPLFDPPRKTATPAAEPASTGGPS
ncbi:MAG: aminomethyltransferase family protein [Acidimicrobiales bacterium]